MASNSIFPSKENESVFNQYKREELQHNSHNQSQVVYYPPSNMAYNSANLSNELLQDELNSQMNGIYLQTPKSASSPSFHSFSNIVQTSPGRQLTSNILPITPTINSSPTFNANSGNNISHNLYISNFDSPSPSKNFTTSHVDISQVNPAGLGLSDINFSSEEAQIPQMISSNNTQHNSQIMQLEGDPFPHYEQATRKATKDSEAANMNPTNTSSNVDNSKKQLDSNLDHTSTTDNYENSFNFETSFIQDKVNIEEFLFEDPFELSNNEKNDSSSENDHLMAKYVKFGSDPLEADSKIPEHKEISGDNLFSASLVESGKNISKKNRKKSLVSTTKVGPKKILKKSTSFNGNSSVSSNTNLALANQMIQMSPQIKNDQAFSFNDCSNTFALNVSNSYSFIIENDNVCNKMKKRSNSKSERPVLKHSSTFSHFDASITNKNSPKVLKNMKSGMGMFQLEFNGTSSVN